MRAYRLIGKKLYKRISEKVNLPVEDVIKVLEAFREVIAEGLIRNRRVIIPNFIRFEIGEVKGYEYTDPRTGEEKETPPTERIYTRLHKKVRERIRDESKEMPPIYKRYERK